VWQGTGQIGAAVLASVDGHSRSNSPVFASPSSTSRATNPDHASANVFDRGPLEQAQKHACGDEEVREHAIGNAADQQDRGIAPDFHAYHLVLQRARQANSLPYYDKEFAKAHPKIADPVFRETRVKIYNAHKMRVHKTISDKEFAAQVAPWLPRATNADRVLGEPKSEPPGPDLLRLREIVNRLRWERGLPKLSSDEILRLIAPLEEDEDAEEEHKCDWLRDLYDQMDDQLLPEQIGYNEELPSGLADDLEELLDWSESPRRHLIRSRLINWLVDRELAGTRHACRGETRKDCSNNHNPPCYQPWLTRRARSEPPALSTMRAERRGPTA
jgi:hypothetical protein